MSRGYDVIVIGGSSLGAAPARSQRAVCASHSSIASWWAAGALTLKLAAEAIERLSQL
jgi:hypothetical protein